MSSCACAALLGVTCTQEATGDDRLCTPCRNIGHTAALLPTPPPDARTLLEAMRLIPTSMVHVIVPTSDGTYVCVVGDLTARLDDDEPLDEAVSNSAIDDIDATRPERLAEHVERVRALNTTGDAAAYWGHT